MKEFKNYMGFSINGFLMISLIIISCLLYISYLTYSGGVGPVLFNINHEAASNILQSASKASTLGTVEFILFLAAGFVILKGWVIIQPNENIVLIFLGKYIGTIKENGFLWTIPFAKRIRVSNKYINFNTGKIKVNDAKGNPIEVGAIVVWCVSEAALAILNVDDYYSFVTYQSDSALRTLVAKYPYSSEEGPSLKSSMENITDILKEELQARLKIAGVFIEEVRFSYLAYAPEIAAAMLKRQQAEATLEARRYLVQNALLIIDDVMAHFNINKELNKEDNNCHDDNSKDSKNYNYSLNLVNNLLVALITESEVRPVLNVGQ